MRLSFLFLLPLLMATPAGGAETASSPTHDPLPAAGGRFGWFGYAGGSGLRTFDVADLRFIRSFGGSGVEYENSFMTLVPLAYSRQVNNENVWSAGYNFRGLVDGLTWGLSYLTGGVKRKKGEVVSFAPWHYLLFAPDWRLRIRMTGRLRLLAGMRSDYLLLRTTDTDRGIMFTPHVGLDLVKGSLGDWDYGGLSLLVGYRIFWDFDGPGRSGDWALAVSLWGPSGV